ncbi:GrpB family protein [Vagococcus carniphilus]|uniref:GrpB family protein n=1 Tax=Vagococcus carniphilus TaxID=218144 RepID=UPI0028915008|nr:GrpB family protein [Vagococcus carniphilus]MDT2830650.1 GrpB family protein [Vagococcus carniphilus]MDT2839950.1 GrpB family protein [Vagococcus carniphilus]MDT2854604.1 GrpB family protein [Vagococcus carniphilus]MDT2864212.1 GrpB family protein [Vagococcus carniphilus]
MQKIKVVSYKKEWPELFNEEKETIKSFMTNNLVEIYHIGSTSVPNLAAKPVIDILLIVENIAELDNLNPKFEAIGYEALGEFGMPGRRYFRKGGDDRTHQIHAFQYDSIFDIERHLAFRDYLIHHERVAKKYGELKAELALKYPECIDSYGDGKDAFVKETEKKALIWYWKNRK